MALGLWLTRLSAPPTTASATSATMTTLWAAPAVRMLALGLVVRLGLGLAGLGALAFATSTAAAATAAATAATLALAIGAGRQIGLLALGLVGEIGRLVIERIVIHRRRFDVDLMLGKRGRLTVVGNNWRVAPFAVHRAR